MTTIVSDSDQNEFDEHPPEWHDHFVKAMMHHTGHGPHPGEYQGPSILAEVRAEAGPEEPEEKGPLPPQETLEQPSPQGGKPKGEGKPSGTTPAALGEKAVEPEEPSGEF